MQSFNREPLNHSREESAVVWMLIFFVFFVLVGLFVEEERRREIETQTLTKFRGSR